MGMVSSEILRPRWRKKVHVYWLATGWSWICGHASVLPVVRTPWMCETPAFDFYCFFYLSTRCRSKHQVVYCSNLPLWVGAPIRGMSSSTKGPGIWNPELFSGVALFAVKARLHFDVVRMWCIYLVNGQYPRETPVSMMTDVSVLFLFLVFLVFLFSSSFLYFPHFVVVCGLQPLGGLLNNPLSQVSPPM